MKKILYFMMFIVGCLAIGVLFGGCVASDMYEKAKPIYKVGKEIVKVSPITDKTKARLKKINGEVMDYDKVRNVVKPIIEKRVIIK